MAENINALDFGKNFFWGVSSSAPQTEGAYNVEGRGPSIWDEFALRPGKIINDERPNTACNFYENYKKDILLLKQLGIPNFRMSFSWSRIFPQGTGKINPHGINFYHEVLNTCIENGIEPWITLYHWDLPLALEKKGGWTNREIINWFSEYVEFCVKEFGTKIKYWIVLNEPVVFTGAGYFLGAHAPGRRGLKNFLPAVHHAAMCQALGFRIIKKINPRAKVGTTFSCSHITPNSKSFLDLKAADRVDALLNRLFIEPSLGLGYPIKTLPYLKKINNYILEGDMDLVHVHFDFIGIQNYTREVVKHSFYTPYIFAKLIPADKRKVFYTQMDWEVYPKGIYYMLKRFSEYKHVKDLIITENGASFPDTVINGEINDEDRKNYIASYLTEVLKAKKENIPVKGYFVWSFTDNFEWGEGYKQRFGLVYVDYATQKRTVKKSGLWYSKFIREARYHELEEEALI